jgi:2-octaprenylphenol hydroxylase
MHQVDIAIVGGGIVGLALARALQTSELSIAIISDKPLHQGLSESPELRVSAINGANQEMLAQLGVWSHLPSARLSPYQAMSVWDKDSFGRIDFDASTLALDTLGHIVENQALVNALAETLEEQANVSILAPVSIDKILTGKQETMLMLANDDVVSCRLLVGADGANSLIRKQAQFPLTFKDYDHTAIVATIRTQHGHNATARQAFTPSGPLALLPLKDPNLCSIVWSQQSEHADALLRLDDSEFVKTLNVASDNVLGKVHLESPRQHFPLTMRYARQWLTEGRVIIGDAAHTIHPLAGQGANLGMQDAFALAEQILALENSHKPFYQLRYLRPFERARKTEAVKMIVAMEGFKQLFAGQHPLKKIIRGVGMRTADAIPAVKQHFISKALGW